MLLIVPILLLSRRLQLARRPWTVRLAFHATGLALYSVLHTTWNWLSRETLFPVVGLGDYDYGILSVRYAMELPKDVSSYVLFFVFVALFNRYRASRDRELRTSRLEARLARARFGERLQVWVAADESVRAALVPTLLLQPLVENAIHHGAPPPPAPARI